jgi:hypothetical protein
LVRVDPMKSPRAVEALRIALGLGSHNEGRDVSIVLGGRAPFLLAEDTSDVADAEILEKHLPVFLEWGTLFAIAPDAEVPPRYAQGVQVKPLTQAELAAVLEAADHVLIFS